MFVGESPRASAAPWQPPPLPALPVDGNTPPARRPPSAIAPLFGFSDFNRAGVDANNVPVSVVDDGDTPLFPHTTPMPQMPLAVPTNIINPPIVSSADSNTSTSATLGATRSLFVPTGAASSLPGSPSHQPPAPRHVKVPMNNGPSSVSVAAPVGPKRTPFFAPPTNGQAAPGQLSAAPPALAPYVPASAVATTSNNLTATGDLELLRMGSSGTLQPAGVSAAARSASLLGSAVPVPSALVAAAVGTSARVSTDSSGVTTRRLFGSAVTAVVVSESDNEDAGPSNKDPRRRARSPS
jgi:hypothetical protein